MESFSRRPATLHTSYTDRLNLRNSRGATNVPVPFQRSWVTPARIRHDCSMQLWLSVGRDNVLVNQLTGSRYARERLQRTPRRQCRTANVCAK